MDNINTSITGGGQHKIHLHSDQSQAVEAKQQPPVKAGDQKIHALVQNLMKEFDTVGLKGASGTGSFDPSTLLRARESTNKYQKAIKDAGSRFGDALTVLAQFKEQLIRQKKDQAGTAKLSPKTLKEIEAGFKEIALIMAKHDSLYDKKTNRDAVIDMAIKDIHDLVQSKFSIDISLDKSHLPSAPVKMNEDTKKELQSALENHILLTNERAAEKDIRAILTQVFKKHDGNFGSQAFAKELKAATTSIKDINRKLLKKERLTIRRAARKLGSLMSVFKPTKTLKTSFTERAGGLKKGCSYPLAMSLMRKENLPEKSMPP